MANQRYNRKETITDGFGTISIKNKIKKVQQARAEGDYDAAQQILDDMDYIFQNDDLNLSTATAVLNDKLSTTGARIESEKLTKLLTSLHSDNFFELVPSGGFSANSAIEKAIDFNDKIVYNQQGVSTFASYTNVVKSYERLQEMKAAGPGNFLYLFDTETIGGKNTSNIWNPLGITEFAMQKIDLATNEVTKTNIVMGVADSIENQKKVEKILNALGSTLGDTKDPSVQSKLTNDLSIIMNDEELRVTAYRLAIYGDPESKFKMTEKGFMEAEALASSEIKDWLDPEKIKAGYLKNVEAYRQSPMTKYGINQAQLTFIDSMHEMWEAANNGTGMIGGQNIVPFDFKVVNAEIARIQKSLEEAVATGGRNGIAPVDAQRGLDYLQTKFGGKYGLTAPNEQIFDTLPMINFIREKFGLNALYRNNQEAIMAAGRGTAKQENIGAVWFPEFFASGQAHMADFDVDVQRHFFTQGLEEFGGKTFIEHFMEEEGNGGLKGLGIDAKTIKAGGEQQLLYARKGTRDRTFGGKAGLDFTRNKRTGEVFTSTNYEIMGPNKMPEFKGNINMGTHINKGHFYYVDSIKKIDARELSKDIGDVLPELSGPEIFQVKMRMAVSDKHKGKGLEDLEYVLHFGSEYELSGWFSGNFDMALEKNEAGEYVLGGNNALDILEQVRIKDGKLIREEGYYLQDVNTMKERALERANEKALTDKALRDLSDPNKVYSRVEDQVEIRKYLAKNGLENITTDEISKILYGETIERMNNMTPKQSQQIIDDVIKLAGFTDRKTKDTKLYSNTVNKMLTSWNFVGAHDEFYMKVFDDLETYSKTNKLTKKQREYMFNNVVNKLKSQVADQLLQDPEKMKSLLYNVRDFDGSLDEIMNVYDVMLPDTFAMDMPKSVKVQTGANLNANKNIISLRLRDNASSFQLEDALVKAKYGDLDLRANPDNYKRTAMYEFVTHLSGMDEFKDNEKIIQALEHMNADTTKFNSNAVARDVIEAMKEVKAADPSKGVLKDINVRSLLESVPEFDKALNEIAETQIIQAINESPLAFDLMGKKGKQKEIKKFIESDVLKHYLPSQADFDKTLVGLNKQQKWQKTLLYNTLKEQITNSLTDITSSLSQVPNGELFIMPDGRFVFKNGQDAVTIDNIPKIKLDGDTLYGQVGRSPVQVYLDLVVDANGKVKISTNLGESYEKNRQVARFIDKRVKEGTFKTEDALRITSHLSEEFRQDSRYEFKSGDYLSNFMVGTDTLDSILPDLFAEDGRLKGIGDNINLSDQERQVLAEAFKNADKDIKPGELDPVINQYLVNYRIEILQKLAESGGTSDVRKLASTLTIGTKGKGKLQKSKLMGSNMRFATGSMNTFDNLGRPVVDGSGNVKFIRSDQIRKATNQVRGVFYEGALLESLDTDHMNKYTSEAVGDLITGWTSRTAYVGQYGIKSLIENNYDKVLSNNSIKHLNKEKKENIYNMLHAYVNTFEQQKVLDARAFDAVTGGTMSANTIKLSNAKDFINIPNEEKLLHADKYQRLMNLMGDIKVDPDGIIEYKSTVGDIVKYGETIIPFATYGGESARWSSKMQRSLLRFQVFDKKGVALNDNEISKLLNKHVKNMQNIDVNKKSEVLNFLVRSLESEGVEFNFTLEDVNRTTLPKILANDSEKSMNHILYAKIGTVDERVAKVFKMYSPETAELLQGTVLSEQSFKAYFKDTLRAQDVAVQAGFKDWDEFVGAWHKEMYTMRDVLFGKGGIFEGFTDIANDNLLGHDNKGTMIIGSLDEAISMLGKYSNNGVENQRSRQKGLEKFVEMYNKIDDKGYNRFGFFMETVADENGNLVNKAMELEVVNGHLRFKDGRSFYDGLDNPDYIDNKKLEDLVREIDTFVKGQGAGKEDWLIHKVKTEKDKKTGATIFYADDEGEEIIGRMIYSKRDGKDVIVGSSGIVQHKIVVDPETQSGIPQEYYDTKMEYMKTKAKKVNLEHQYEAMKKEFQETGMVDEEKYNKITKELAQANVDLQNMDEYLKNIENLEGVAPGYRIGDQEEKIIKNYFINKNSFEALDDRVATGQISEETIKSSNILRGIDRSMYTTESGDIIFKGLLDELAEQRYYNPYIDSKVLTPGKLEKERYKHLKPIYETIVEGKMADKLGVETAETIYSLQMAKLADEFNNVNKDVDKMIDAGFKVYNPEDYIRQFGDPKVPGYTSAIKENVLLKLDLGDGTVDYVAVPGMGSVLDKAEIKQDWHKHAGRIADIYTKKLEPLHGAPVDREEVLKKIADAKLELQQSTANYLEKDSDAQNLMRQEVHAAVDRVKIISTMSDPDNPLMQQAMIGGKSLAEWTKAGVYHDYAFDSLESFEKRGFFKKEYLAKMGMSREEMIEHLRTQGTVMIDDRYPNIRERSITPVRHFLAVDDQGMSFLANNATMMAPHTALAMNADSDGDSVSRFLAKHKNIDHVQYGIARQQATELLEGMQDFASKTNSEKEALIKSRTIDIMEKKFGIYKKKYKSDTYGSLAEEAYDVFFKQEAAMDILAMTQNIDWHQAVVDTWASDSKKTVQAMTLKYGADYSGSEVKGGKSVFGYTKFTALSETPTWSVTRKNLDEVNNMLDIVQKNAHLLSEETRNYAKDILDNAADIVVHNDEAKALDQALVAYNELTRVAESGVTSEGFAHMQEEAIKRARISKYQIEGMKKLGVTATGNVNSTLYGVSQAVKSYYGDINSVNYNEEKRAIMSEMSYLLEESPISGKKYEIKAGDTRLIEFTDMFKKMESQGPTEKNIETMKNYFDKYMNHGQIVTAYHTSMEKAGVAMADRLTDDKEIVNYMIDNYVGTISEALDKKGPMYKEVVGHRNLFRRKVQAGIIDEVAGQVETGTSQMADAATILSNRNTKIHQMPKNTKSVKQAKETAEETIRNFNPPKIDIDTNERKVAEVVEAGSNKIAKSIMNNAGGIKKSLALGVVGLAAGLIAAGYASGNPLNDPDPATVTQKGFEGVQAAPDMMFGSGASFANNNTGGYIINIKGDTKHGNRQLKKALKQATRNAVGPTGVTMNIRTSRDQRAYSDRDIENILNNYF